MPLDQSASLVAYQPFAELQTGAQLIAAGLIVDQPVECLRQIGVA
jgi:hypothetical protein